MKHLFFILTTALFLAISTTGISQSASGTLTADRVAEKVIPEPQYDNSVVYYDAESNEMKDLEVVRSETERKISAVSFLPIGVSGGKNNLVLPGGASPVVLPQDAEFLIKLSAGNVDPNRWVMLYRLEQQIKANPAKSKRIMVVSKSLGMGAFLVGGHKEKSVSDESQMAQMFEKVHEGVFRLKPVNPLAPGEYFFTILDPNSPGTNTPIVYAFGIQ